MEFSFGRSRENHQQQQQPQPKDATSSSSPTYQWAPSSSDRPTTEPPPPPPPPVEEREHMFEKVVTPSDVGKLNRLVIPKQHAEKYFPLDPTANDKGLLLSFEDRTGKPWRFRYSYWNSSQSYVMTKGWSRFVKEKRLDAGDTVLFGRAAGRLFIDWRRRPPDPPAALPIPMTIMPRSSGWGGYFPPPAPMYGMYFRHGVPARVLHPHPGGGAAVVLDSVPVAAAAVVGHGESAAEPKRVRLFGVNLDCSQAPPAGSLPPPSPLQWRLSATAPPSGRSELPLLLPPPMDLGSPCKKEEGRRRMDSSEN